MMRFLFATLASLAFAHGATANETGRALFNGELPLSATLRHSDEQLPQSAVTCSNCHMVGCKIQRDGDQGPPMLGPLHLLSEVKRISGPPVAYDQAGFCEVLETGRTPSHTVTTRTMPQYTMDAQSCTAIWEYLTGTQHDC